MGAACTFHAVHTKEIIKCMPKVQAASLEMLLKITKKYQKNFYRCKAYLQDTF